MRESKECLECGGIYFRPEGYSDVQWGARRFCSRGCVAVVGRRTGAARRASDEARASEADKAAGGTGVGDSVREGTKDGAPVITEEVRESDIPTEGVKGIERELRIVRVGPNPRMVVCEYFELASRRTCVVDVKRNAKYTKGMRMRIFEPRDEVAFNHAWKYEGRPPRWKGRW